MPLFKNFCSKIHYFIQLRRDYNSKIVKKFICFDLYFHEKDFVIFRYLYSEGNESFSMKTYDFIRFVKCISDTNSITKKISIFNVLYREENKRMICSFFFIDDYVEFLSSFWHENERMFGGSVDFEIIKNKIDEISKILNVDFEEYSFS